MTELSLSHKVPIEVLKSNVYSQMVNIWLWSCCLVSWIQNACLRKVCDFLEIIFNYWQNAWVHYCEVIQLITRKLTNQSWRLLGAISDFYIVVLAFGTFLHPKRVKRQSERVSYWDGYNPFAFDIGRVWLRISGSLETTFFVSERSPAFCIQEEKNQSPYYCTRGRPTGLSELVK